MRQLHSGDAPLFMNEADDSTQHLDVPVRPDAEVLRTDASLGKNGRCLSQYQSGATDRAAAEMNEMPVVSVAVVARILTHRRDEHPIGKRSDLESRADQTGRAWSVISYQVISYQLPAVVICYRFSVITYSPDPPIQKNTKMRTGPFPF